VAVHRQLEEARAILESPDADAPDEPEESLQ
jgi:hypothetical protein